MTWARGRMYSTWSDDAGTVLGIVYHRDPALNVALDATRRDAGGGALNFRLGAFRTPAEAEQAVEACFRPPCKHGDPFCPCQDGDLCHYEGANPMNTPRSGD